MDIHVNSFADIHMYIPGTCTGSEITLELESILYAEVLQGYIL